MTREPVLVCRQSSIKTALYCVQKALSKEPCNMSKEPCMCRKSPIERRPGMCVVRLEDCPLSPVYTYTHTYMSTYVYTYIFIYVCMYIRLKRGAFVPRNKTDEKLKQYWFAEMRWQFPLKMMDPRHPPNREPQIPRYKFKLNQNLNLNLYRICTVRYRGIWDFWFGGFRGCCIFSGHCYRGVSMRRNDDIH